MSTLYYGSIDVSKLLTLLKEKHSSFVKANNGKVYCNINVWKNDQPDSYGNLLSIMLNSTQDRREREGKVYIGNCKESEYKGPKPLSNADLTGIDEINSIINNDSFNQTDDDLPF